MSHLLATRCNPDRCCYFCGCYGQDGSVSLLVYLTARGWLCRSWSVWHNDVVTPMNSIRNPWSLLRHCLSVQSHSIPHKSSSSSLYPFDGIDESDGIRVPQWAGIFQLWSDKSFVCEVLVLVPHISIFLRSMANCLEAFWVIVLTWVFHRRSTVTVIPRYLHSSIDWNLTPFILH